MKAINQSLSISEDDSLPLIQKSVPDKDQIDQISSKSIQKSTSSDGSSNVGPKLLYLLDNQCKEIKPTKVTIRAIGDKFKGTQNHFDKAHRYDRAIVYPV